MQYMLNTCIIECIHMSGTIISVLVMRWLLALSTPEKDMIWLQGQTWYRNLSLLHYYRGVEYLHQIRARRIMK